MSKEELLRIYSAYLPYDVQYTTESFPDEYHHIVGLDKTHLGNERFFVSRPNNITYAVGLKQLKPVFYSMDMLTQPIKHKGKTVTPIIELLDQASLYDLSDCEFEINIEDEEIYIDAYNGGRLVDAMFYNGNIFKMNGNTKYYPPQIDLNELMLELHLNVFNLPDSAYIKKENHNGNDTNVATKNLK